MDKLLEIQTRINPVEVPNYPDIASIKDEQERTRIALDAIERRLSPIAEVHKDDLRTRSLQTSRNLLAFLFERPCNIDDSLHRTNPDFADQLYLTCLKGLREEYLKTYQGPTLEIIDELQRRGLDVRHVKGLAESGWNNTVVERLAIELSQLAEKLPKEN